MRCPFCVFASRANTSSVNVQRGVRETSGGSFLRPMIFSGFFLLSMTKNENRGNRISFFSVPAIGRLRSFLLLVSPVHEEPILSRTQTNAVVVFLVSCQPRS